MKRIFSSMMLGLVTMTICSWSVDARADATPQGSQVQAVILACRVDTLAITSCSTSPGSGFTCPAVDSDCATGLATALSLQGAKLTNTLQAGEGIINYVVTIGSPLE
jgi:hypothetical protein